MLERILGLLESIVNELKTLNSKVVSDGAAPAATTRKKRGDDPALPAPAAPAPAAGGISREALGEKLMALAKTDIDTAKGILAKFKATKLAEVAESDYAAVLKDVEAAAAKPTADSLL